MSYITNADIELRLGSEAYVQLTDDAATGSANTEIVDAVRTAAEGEVNSYLARSYFVPVDVVGFPEVRPVVAAVTLDLAEYRLHARRPPVPEEVAEKYRSALEWLAGVSVGAVRLPSIEPLPDGSARGPLGAVFGDSAVLSREGLRSL